MSTSKISNTLLLIALCAATLRNAKATDITIDPPDIKVSDSAGVDLVSGLPQFTNKTISIGPSGRELSQVLNFSGFVELIGDRTDTNYGSIIQEIQPFWCAAGVQCPEFTVRLDGSAEGFYLYNGVYISERQRGTTLVKNTDGTYTITKRDGTRYKADPGFSAVAQCTTQSIVCAAITEITYPTGLVTSINYIYTGFTDTAYKTQRIQSVSRNDGFQLRYNYALNSTPSSSTASLWKIPSSVTAINSAIDYCAPTATSCSYSRVWPTATFTWAGTAFPSPNQDLKPQLLITGASGLVTRYTQGMDSNLNVRVIYYKPPSSSSADTVSYAYGNPSTCDLNYYPPICSYTRYAVTAQVSSAGGLWQYTYLHDESYANTSNSDSPVYYNFGIRSVAPDGRTSVVTYNTKDRRIGSESSGLEYAGYTLDMANYVAYNSDSQGRYFTYQHDFRGNTMERRQVAAPASGLADSVYTANFDSICSNPVTCNRPNWIKDPNGNQSDFTYDSVHGGMLTDTSPTPAAGKVRPQKRYTYVQRYAWVKNSGGTYSQASPPIWLVSMIGSCITGAWSSSVGKCVDTNGTVISNDEVVTTYDYGPDSGPNNLFLRGQIVTADGQSLRTCYAYDVVGNRISETTPNANLGSCP